jgi:hypothetical protein
VIYNTNKIRTLFSAKINLDEKHRTVVPVKKDDKVEDRSKTELN